MVIIFKEDTADSNKITGQDETLNTYKGDVNSIISCIKTETT